LDEKRIYRWMKHGAQPTESVEKILKTAGTLERFERYKQGDTLEVLLEEAAAAESKRAAPVRTRK